MKVLKQIKGSAIKAYFDSSNVLYAQYDMNKNELIIVFKKGKAYIYKNVPHRIFVQLERADSQGKFLNQQIKPYYDYEQIEDYDIEKITQTINHNKKNY